MCVYKEKEKKNKLSRLEFRFKCTWTLYETVEILEFYCYTLYYEIESKQRDTKSLRIGKDESEQSTWYGSTIVLKYSVLACIRFRAFFLKKKKHENLPKRTAM